MLGKGGPDFQTRKNALEAKIKALDSERASLTKEIQAIEGIEFVKQKQTMIDLERTADSLERDVELLRKQKDGLMRHMGKWPESSPESQSR